MQCEGRYPCVKLRGGLADGRVSSLGQVSVCPVGARLTCCGEAT